MKLCRFLSAAFGSLSVFAAASSAQAQTTPFVGMSSAPLVSRGPEAPRAALTRILPHVAGADLVVTGEIDLEGGERLVRFEQRHRGVPVLGRGATIRLDAGGHGAIAAARVESRLPHDVSPKIDESAAARVAGASSGLAVGRGGLVIAPFLGGAALVWDFEPRFAGLPFAPQILIDATTGEVRVLRDRAVSLAPTASVFATNPTRTPRISSLPLAIAPTTSRLESPAIVAKTCIDRGKVLDVPGFDNGIHACELDSIAQPNANGNYAETPNDDAKSPARNEDAFAELSMYYHVGRVYSFFERLAPPGTTRIVEGAPFTAVANLRIAAGLASGADTSHIGDSSFPLAPFSNAFFAPSSDLFAQFYNVKGGALWFGQGPRRDYAYDGDVVYHEFTHGVVDASIGLGNYTFDEQGTSAAPGALNEGLADLFSSALSGDPDIGEYAADDIHPGLPYVRTLANADHCPTGFVGEVHFDSTAFSGALWSARATLSEVERVVFDRLLYETLLAHPHFDSPTWNEFIDFMLATFHARSSLAARAVERELTVRGLYPSCERVLDATDRIVESPSDGAGKLGFQAPGRFDTGAKFVPGTITFRVALDAPLVPAATRSLTVAYAVRKASTSLLFGQQGTAFAPVVLVRWNEPLRFQDGNHNADATAEPAQDETSVSIPIPDNAKIAYVQIANKGDRAGTFDSVKIRTASTLALESPDYVDDEPQEKNSGCALTPSSHANARSTGATGPIAVAVLLGALFVKRRRRL